MKNKFIRCMSLCLVLFMMISVLGACGDSDEYVVSEVWIEEDVEDSESDAQGNDTSDKGSSDTASDDKKNPDKNTASGNNQNQATASGDKNTASSTSSDNKNNTSGGKTDSKAEKYRGTTVKYATWKDPKLNEDGKVVDSFQKKYGIKVQIVNVPQGGYVQKIMGYIAAGDAPDVFIDTQEWPATIGIAQPITNADIDMKDPIWDQETFKNTTINGKIYGINTLGNIWSEADCVFFNKKLMQDKGITTPEEYYKAGKWNFDTMYKCLTDCKNAGFKGGFLNPQSLATCFDADWVKMSNGKLVNNSNNPMLVKVFQYVAKCNKEGLLVNADTYFNDGDVGICIGNVFGVKKTGTFHSMNPDYIGYTFMPDYDSKTKAEPCGLTRFYGICKKAKNPKAAGVFLRYYLDAANYDLNETFISTDAASFFFKVTTPAVKKKNCYYLNGLSSIVGTFTHFEYSKIAYEDPAQVPALIKAKSNAIDGYVKTANNFIQTQSKK